MLLEIPSGLPNLPPAVVCTVGLSRDAQFVDQFARDSLTKFRQARFLDDGRRGVQSKLAGQQEHCARPDWDGYGAEPVTMDTYRNACRFVEALPAGFPMPSVGVEADGHLTLEWYRNPSRVVSVSISPEGCLHYAALLGASIRKSGTELFLGEVPADLLQLIRRVIVA